MRHEFHDPVTGDRLSALEFYTRQVQVVVRTPLFIVGFNVLTVVGMLTGHADSWNYFASWLAIMVEWLVGTFMFGQTKRDAIVIRRIEHMEARILEHLDENAGQGSAAYPPAPDRCS